MEFSKRSLIMTIKIVCGAPYNVMGGKCAVVMVPFGGKAFGPYFSGDIIGTGVDSQRITRGGAQLSARYMLEGEDCEGEKCRIFIENSGTRIKMRSRRWMTGSLRKISRPAAVLTCWR